jgi:FkbM family methyltransferase
MATLMGPIRSLAKFVLSRFGYVVVRYSLFDEWLKSLLNSPGFFFIQVGANDGVRFDGLYQKVTAINANGIVIEPLPRYFKRLAANYEDYPGVRPLNVALHPTLNRVEIFHVDPTKACPLPPWTHGIGSVDRDHHRRSGTPADCMTSTIVEAMPFTAVLDKFDVRRIDLLQIDTEGFDLAVLEMVPFGRIRPRLIKFEVAVMDDVSKEKAFGLLARHGYRTHIEGEDGIAILDEPRKHG